MKKRDANVNAFQMLFFFKYEMSNIHENGDVRVKNRTRKSCTMGCTHGAMIAGISNKILRISARKMILFEYFFA